MASKGPKRVHLDVGVVGQLEWNNSAVSATSSQCQTCCSRNCLRRHSLTATLRCRIKRSAVARVGLREG